MWGRELAAATLATSTDVKLMTGLCLITLQFSIVPCILLHGILSLHYYETVVYHLPRFSDEGLIFAPKRQ